MASDRTANIRLEIKNSGFKSGLKDAEKAATGVAARMSSAFKAAGGALKGISGIAGTGFRTLESVIGDISLTGLIKGAIESKAQFQRLGFAVQAATGNKADIGAMRDELQAMALDTGQSTKDLADHFQDLLTKTGDLDFTKSALKDIAVASTASGHSMGTLVEIIDGVNQQFGVTKEQVPDVLAQMLSLGNKSGVALEDFAAKFELVAASANKAGLEGTEGLSQTAAVMKFANDALGGMKKGVAAATGLFDLLGNKQERTMALLKLGISPSAVKGGPMDAIKAMIQATGGKKEKLEVAVGAEQAKLLVEMGKEYASTFDSTKGDVQTKTKAALDALDSSLRSAARSTLSAADVQGAAADAMKGPQANINKALEMLSQSFNNPAMMEGISALAGALPVLANAVGQAAGWIAKTGSTVYSAMSEAIEEIKSWDKPVRSALDTGDGRNTNVSESIRAWNRTKSMYEKQAKYAGRDTPDEAYQKELNRRPEHDIDAEIAASRRERAQKAFNSPGASAQERAEAWAEMQRSASAADRSRAIAAPAAGAPGAPGAAGGAVDSQAVGQAAGAAAGRAAADAVSSKPVTVKVTIEDKTKGGVQPGYAFRQ